MMMYCCRHMYIRHMYIHKKKKKRKLRYEISDTHSSRLLKSIWFWIVYMVSCCLELLVVELVMLFFVEIEIKKNSTKRPIQNTCTLLCRIEIHVPENSQTCLSSVADSHSNRDKHTNFKTIILYRMIFIYVQFYPNIHKAAITNTQSVHIHIHNPQSQPTTKLIQASCWHPSHKCCHERQTYIREREDENKRKAHDYLNDFQLSQQALQVMLKSGTISVPQREKSVYTCCPEMYNSSSSEVVIELVPVRSGDDSRTISCRDKELINSGYELEDLSWDLPKCQNLASIVGKNLSTKGTSHSIFLFWWYEQA